MSETTPETVTVNADEAAAVAEAMAEHIAAKVAGHLAPGMISGILPPAAARELAAMVAPMGGAWHFRQALAYIGPGVVEASGEVRKDGSLSLELTVNAWRVWAGVLRPEPAAEPAACGYVHDA